MTDYSAIYEALDRDDAEEARELLRPILQEVPESPEAWYLAARAARNASQQRHFLEKATELDPLYAPAANALHTLNHPQPPPAASAPDASVQRPASRQKLAPLDRRALAFAMDQGFLLMVGFMLSWLLFPEDAINQQSAIMDGVIPTWVAVWILAASLTHILYHMYFLMRDGQTPGKRFARVKVIRRDNQPLTVWDVFLRCYVGYSLNLGLFGMGFVWANNNALQQGWHDMVADTLVVEATPS